MNFDTWWHQEGSGIIPNDKEDMEEFAKRIAKIAWSNGAYIEREVCAKVCEVEATVIVTNASEQYQEGRSMGAAVCAAAIRARGEK